MNVKINKSTLVDTDTKIPNHLLDLVGDVKIGGVKKTLTIEPTYQYDNKPIKAPPPPPPASIIITRETQKRLVKDVKDIIVNPLTSEGIYYIHDEDNMLKGYAMIIGPEQTLYADGFFFFKLDIPYNYPYAPPTVTYLTQGDNIRFHPNLYRNGKVCLSILNTWRGEQWTACQTLRSVLLTLVTLFHNKPLLNEPGITERYKDFKAYNKIIEFKTYDVAIYKIVAQQDFIPVGFSTFFIFIKKHFLKKYEEIIKRIDKKRKENEGATDPDVVSVGLYNMKNIFIDYNDIRNKLETAYFNLIQN